MLHLSGDTWHLLLPALQVIAAAKQAGRLEWLLHNILVSCGNVTDTDAELALAMGAPALFTTAASLALQARQGDGTTSGALRAACLLMYAVLRVALQMLLGAHCYSMAADQLTATCLPFQSPADSTQDSLERFIDVTAAMPSHIDSCPGLAVGFAVGAGSLLELLLRLGCIEAGCLAEEGEEQVGSWKCMYDACTAYSLACSSCSL